MGLALLLAGTLLLVAGKVMRSDSYSKTSQDLVTFVLNIRKYYEFEYVLFLMEGNKSVKINIDYLYSKKLLSVHGVLVSEASTKTLYRFISGRPLVCVLLVNSTLDDYLSQAFQHADVSWLFYLSNTHSLENIFSGIDIPITNTVFIAEYGKPLTLVYRKHPGDPLIIETVQFQLRRNNDLHNVEIRATTVQYPPLTDFKITVNEKIFGGFFGVLWTTLEKHLNFRTVYCPPIDSAWGRLDNSSGSWSGMMGQLQRKDEDVAVSNMMLVSQRWDVVDFIMPQFTTRFNIFIKEPSPDLWMWNTYLAPFHPYLWFSVLCLILFSSLYMVFLNKLAGHYEYRAECTINEIFFTMLGTFCMQGNDARSERDSHKIIWFILHLTSLILLSAYSATLVSSLIVQRTALPFRDLEGLLTDGTYKLGMLKSSTLLEFFQNSLPLYQEIYTRIILSDTSNLVDTIESGFHKVCTDKFAFMSTMEVAVPVITKLPCKVTVLPMEYFEVHLGIAFTKDSPYKNIINQRLMWMRDSGLLKKIQDITIPKLLSSLSHNEYINVHVEKVVPVFCVFMCGILLSVLLLWLEIKFRSALHVSEKIT